MISLIKKLRAKVFTPSLQGRVRGGSSLLLSLWLFACTSPSVPTSFTDSDERPAIYPDYVGVTVPVNIAPLHFHIDHDSTATDFVTRFTAGAEAWTFSGEDVRPGLKNWKQMKAAALAADGKLAIEVFVKQNEAWRRQKPFEISVSNDSIDPYISYRLISPSYVTYEDLTLNQRCLENFEESLIYGNMINSDEENGQCINCHHAQWYNPNRIQFHVRQYLGGTQEELKDRAHHVRELPFPRSYQGTLCRTHLREL